MGSPAICYVSDIGFLAPTLLSIASARRFVPASVPIYIIAIHPEGDMLEGLEPLLSSLSVTVIAFDQKRLDSIAKVWAKSHVPIAALGRFFLSELLPEQIDRILYVDGDTLFVSDPTPLLVQTLPEGKIGMVEDAMSFYRHDQSANGTDTRQYLLGLGLSPDAHYGNSGVFIVSRGDWKAIAGDALNYLSSHSDKCRYHDQSALNAVVGDRRFSLSPIWNYQSRFVQWRVKPIAEPAILHFTGAAKPWMGKVYPWSTVSDQLTSTIHELSIGNLPVRRMSAKEVLDHNRQYEGVKQVARRFLDRRQMRRVTALRQYHRAAVM